jgi:hypothetical protein
VRQDMALTSLLVAIVLMWIAIRLELGLGTPLGGLQLGPR